MVGRALNIPAARSPRNALRGQSWSLPEASIRMHFRSCRLDLMQIARIEQIQIPDRRPQGNSGAALYCLAEVAIRVWVPVLEQLFLPDTIVQNRFAVDHRSKIQIEHCLVGHPIDHPVLGE